MSLSISFQGKRILITGATRGLGRELVSILHSQGAIIYALSKTPETLAQLKDDFPNISTICVDLEDWEATRNAVSQIETVDCLINNAGVAHVASFLTTTKEQIKELFDINVSSVVNISQIVASRMISRGTGGSIINISSLGSKICSKNISGYSMTKAALDLLTKSMAMELGEFQIRVNSINPITFLSDKTKSFLSANPDGGPAYLNRVPIKRIANTTEIVNTVLFVMSDAAPMINGETIVIDGGFSVA